MNRCCGINVRGKRCGSHGFNICEDCGKPFCYHHVNRDKHKHSIWKHFQNINKDNSEVEI